MSLYYRNLLATMAARIADFPPHLDRAPASVLTCTPDLALSLSLMPPDLRWAK